jgi:hypothetical protein
VSVGLNVEETVEECVKWVAWTWVRYEPDRAFGAELLVARVRYAEFFKWLALAVTSEVGILGGTLDNVTNPERLLLRWSSEERVVALMSSLKRYKREKILEKAPGCVGFDTRTYGRLIKTCDQGFDEWGQMVLEPW